MSEPGLLMPSQRIARLPSELLASATGSGYGLSPEQQAKARRRIGGVAVGLAVIHAFGFLVTLGFESLALQAGQVVVDLRLVVNNLAEQF